MATTAEYLNKLVTQKNTLADNLVTKGVSASHDETLETLVPKVLEISGGSGEQLGVYPIAEDGRPTGDVIVPEGVVNLNQYVVRTGITGADSRITSVTLPETLHKIGNSALSGLTSITSLDLKNVTEIESIGLYSCSNLTNVNCPKVEKIGERAFASTNLKNIQLPNTLTHIDTGSYYSFLSCKDLSELSVQEGFNCDLKISQGNLSAEQMRSIIANYADNSGKTLTVGSDNLAKLSDDDKAVATAKGLTLA